MSALTFINVLLLLTLQATTIYGQGGGHTHSEYASEQELTDLKSELEGKIEAIDAEWERKQQSIDNEMSFWQHSLLSLFEMLHSATSGTYTYMQRYWMQQEEAFKKVEDTIDDLRDYINIPSSCKDLLPNGTSGWYWLKNAEGNVSQQYCDMEREGCGTRGGWMRVAHVDMTQPDQQCPPGLTTITTYNATKRLCGRPSQYTGCVSTILSTNDFPYSLICGKVIGYQYGTPNGPCPYRGETTINDSYIDGVSLTHGSPRQHIWSFMASYGENVGPCAACPCFTTSSGVYAPFIGNDYFCDTGSATAGRFNVLYDDDPLWDGQGCGPSNGCCTFNNPPWFCKQLPHTTSDDLELRICANEGISNEDVPVEHIEIYIQ